MKGKAKTMRFLTIRWMLIATLFLIGVAVLLGVHNSPKYQALAEYNPIRMELKGAKIRNDEHAAMKFYARMDGQTYEECEAENKRVGFVVGYATDIDGELTVDSPKAHDITARAEESTENYVLYAGEVNNTTFALDYSKQIVARGYFYDGEKYTYTDDTVSRSFAYVASKALASGEKSKALLDYIDGAIGDEEVSIVGGASEMNADEQRKLTFEANTEDELVPVWMSNDESVAKIDADGNLTILKGSQHEIVITAVLGSKQAELRFNALAKYSTSYYYENANGEYVADESVMSVNYAKPGETVEADVAEKYLREGGYTLYNEHVAYKADAEVSEDNSTVLKVYYKQNALTGEGQLTDANNGAWQITANYNGNPTAPVSALKDATVKDDGKNASTAIEWNGGYYTELTFNAKNSITDYTKYNAISFTMKNDATSSRTLYLSVVNPDGSVSQATPTGVQNRSWSYYVLPLGEGVDSLDDIRLLAKFSTSYSAAWSAEGKTYFGDFKLIQYQTPDNTLIDFGYSNTALSVATYHGEMAGSSAFVGSGVKDPITGGATLKIQDAKYTGGGSGLVPMDGYAFHLGQKQNSAQGNNLPYNTLKALVESKGEKSLQINFRVYVQDEPRGYSGFWIKPFDIDKDWIWVPAKTVEEGGTGRIKGQWTNVSFTMDALPEAERCRFFITICGDKDGSGNPLAPVAGGGVGGQWYAQMSEIYVSAVTYAYV